MKYAITLITVLLFAPISTLHSTELELTSPLDFQVVQRATPKKGLLRIVGVLFPGDEESDEIRAAQAS